MNANTDRSTAAKDASEAKPIVAWQPLTFHGVAAFAQAPLARLLLVQTVVALVAAASVMWFLYRAWLPTLNEAVRRLPVEGALVSGFLQWGDASPVCLADGRTLAVIIDPEHTGKARTPAQVQVELGRRDVKFFSVFGEMRIPYPPRGILPLNQPEVGPWWGAWAPVLVAIAGIGVGLSLLGIWACLATLYLLPVRLISFLAKRVCGLAGAWCLAGAALMPGALLMSGAIVLYGWGALDLVRLIAVCGVHLLAGWIYLLGSPFCLPRREAAKGAQENPFA